MMEPQSPLSPRASRTSSRQLITSISLVGLLLISSVALFTLIDWPSTPTTHAQGHTVQLGAEVDSSDGDHAFAMVDMQKEARGFYAASNISTDIPRDNNGWPKADAAEVIFDMRPFGAWNPPSDDPENFIPDMSGTYHLSLTGQATISPYTADPAVQGAFTITNEQYNAATNTTTADINMQPGYGLMTLQFTQTKRHPKDALGTGFTNLKIIRPGYPANTNQVFTNEFLHALAPFSLMRFMGWLATNNSNPDFNAPKNTTEWADRTPPNYATQESYNGKHGVAWEYLIRLANLTRKDIWINVPVAASDDYVTQLANLLKSKLNPNIHVYIEYSNEVWNFSFWQAGYNQAAAEAEVAGGGSNLNNDGNTNKYTWGERRYTRRDVEISNIFKSVYGAGAINNTIRVVNSWQFVNPYGFQDQLTWLKNTYGDPSQYLWGIAGGNYSTINGNNSSNDVIINTLNSSTQSNIQYTQSLKSIANSFGLHLAMYETGLDFGQDTTNLPVKYDVNRHDPRIGDVVTNLLHANYDNGVEIASWFTLASAYNRFGFWGLTEDIHNLNTYKMQAAYNFIANYTPGTPTPGTTPSPTATTPGTTPTATPTTAPTLTPSPTPTTGLLATDSFSGNTGALQNSSDGSGWAAAWTTQNNDTTVPGYAIASDTPLTYANLATSGNYATGGSSYLTTGRSLDTTATGPFASYLNNGLIGKQGTTLWVSLLLRKDSDTDQEVSVTLHDSNVPWCVNCSTSKIAFGYFGASSNNNGVRYWSLKIGGTVYPGTTAVTVGQVTLLVVRLDFGSSTTASLFVNPTSLGGDAPTAASIQSSSSTPLSFQSLAYYGGDGANASSLDEIHIGTDYASVTPVQ